MAVDIIEPFQPILESSLVLTLRLRLNDECFPISKARYTKALLHDLVSVHILYRPTRISVRYYRCDVLKVAWSGQSFSKLLSLFAIFSAFRTKKVQKVKRTHFKTLNKHKSSFSATMDENLPSISSLSLFLNAINLWETEQILSKIWYQEFVVTDNGIWETHSELVKHSTLRQLQYDTIHLI